MQSIFKLVETDKHFMVDARGTITGCGGERAMRPFYFNFENGKVPLCIEVTFCSSVKEYTLYI